MDKRQIGTVLVMNGIGLDFQIDAFRGRLILQKAIYLAQAAKVDLGYYYNWYLHGPYCQALADDAFAIKSELSQETHETSGWKLDDDSAEKLEQLKTLFREEDREKRALHLELLASVHFLVSRQQMASNDEQRLTETLKRFDKDFTEQDVKAALGELREHKLL